MKTKKTDKQIAKSDAEKAAQAIALSKAIDAMAGAYAKVENLIARLFDKSEKEAIYKIVADYVKPGTDDDRKRAMQVCNGVKDQLNYDVMDKAEQAALNSTLREFREKIGVKARKTKKRKTTSGTTGNMETSENNSGLPEAGKTEREHVLYAAKILAIVMQACGTDAGETLALFGRAMEVISKQKAA
jgi:septal ring factor EnvC (AmiA/AmiB activator)